jgi:hypothetical protein
MVTTSTYSAIAHRSFCSSLEHTLKPSQPAVSSPTFWQRLPTPDVPLPLGSRTVPVPQLPTSNSNSSQGLNRNSPLTHQPTHSISHQTPTLLTAVWRLSSNGSWRSLYCLSTDRIGDTSPKQFFYCSYRTDRAENTTSQLLQCCVLRICCLATGVFAEPFPSNGCLYWLHSSCLE